MQHSIASAFRVNPLNAFARAAFRRAFVSARQPNEPADREKIVMSKRNCIDPNQIELRITWRPRLAYPFRLRAGDVIRCDHRLCRVIRVTECAAVVMVNRPARDFKTRFDKPVRFTPPPALFRISANSPVEILNLKKYENR